MENTWKKAKRLLSILLCLCMVLSLLPAVPITASALSTTANSEGNFYKIGSAQDLMDFAAKVNGGETTANATLTADINMSGKSWNPIGADVNKPYSGNFDGNGHSIYNLNINKLATSQKEGSTYSYAGLIGYMQGGGVQNLTVNGKVDVTYTLATHGNTHVGLLVGQMQDSIIYNCASQGSVKMTATTAPASANDLRSTSLGGMLGIGQHSIMINCRNEASVTGAGEYILTAGGLVGHLTAGYDVPMCLLNSYSTGALNVNAQYAGGLVGYLADDAVNNYCSLSSVSNSYSYGSSTKTTGVLFGQIGNSITATAGEASTTFTPVIKYNYYVSGATAVGGIANDLDSSGYTTAFSTSALSGSLANTLNGNIGTVKEIIAGHLGYLTTSQWNGLIEKLNGKDVRAMCWATVSGKPVHSDAACSYDAKGFCTRCGGYQQASVSNGVYQIANAGNLFWFAQYVNKGNYSANAKLTADIDLEQRQWTPIASTALYYNTTNYPDKGYTGTFDGNYHSISNLTVTGSSTMDATYGLIGTLSGTVKNLEIGWFRYKSAGKDTRVGAVAGQILPGGTVHTCHIAQLEINTKVNTTNGVAGGIAGCNYGGTVRDCHAYAPRITAGRAGAIVGDNRGDISASDRLGTVQNCYSDGAALEIVNEERKGVETDCAMVSSYRYRSGEITWLLNGSKDSGVWTQNIDVPGVGRTVVPVFGQATVYRYTDCNGVVAYSNTDYPDGHNYVNGVCSVCGATIPDMVVVLIKNGVTVMATNSLDAAIKEAEKCVAADKAVVQLQQSINLGKKNQGINSGVFTIDLNGYEISYTSEAGTMLTVQNSGTNVTIMDSVGTGKLTAYYKVMQGLNGCTLNITGGTFSLNGQGPAVISINPDTTLNITGGSIIGQGGGINNQIGVSCMGTLNITGGTISSSTTGAVRLTGGSAVISGGTITGKTYDLRAFDSGVFELTLGEDGEGATFPGGIAVYGTTLNEMLGEGMAYWQDGKQLSVADDATEITGGDVVIKAACKHPGDKTYTDNGGDHSWTCVDCSNTITEAHSYSDLVCVCGAVSPDAVASATIDGVVSYYSTLSSALSAIKKAVDAEQKVLTLLQNVDLGSGCLNMNRGGLTLDLNGCELQSAHNLSPLLCVDSSVNLIIIDSKGGGKISGEYCVYCSDGTVTIKGGTFVGTLCATYAGVVELALGENGVGATFLGGITVEDVTLNAILGEGMAYWQDGKQLSVADDATEITGGDVIIKAACKHTGDKTYTNNGEYHTCICSDCDFAVTEAHSYTNGICICGAIDSDAVASVSKNGTVTDVYTTLNDAIEAVENCTAADQAVVTILKDIDLGDDYQQIDSGVFTIDLNGCEISSSNADYLGALNLYDGADVTITDSGEGGKIIGDFVGAEVIQGTLHVEGGTITGDTYGVYDVKGTMTVSGGTITGGGIGVYAYDNTSVTVSSGAISGTHGVKVEAGSNLTISGGTISGQDCGVNAYNSTVEISGGTISGDYYGVDANDSFVTVSGGTISAGYGFDLYNCTLTIRDCIVNCERGVSADSSTVTISGGTISAIYDGVDVFNSTVKISGGTIEGSQYGVYVDNNSSLTISGGTISAQTYGVYVWSGSAEISGGTIDSDYCHIYSGSYTVRLILGEDGVGATFPGAIQVSGVYLNAILGEGAAYWQDGKMILLADGPQEIIGGDVVIKAACQHTGDKTYTNNGDDHTYTYTCCGASVTEAHTFVNGQCICGALPAVCVIMDGVPMYFVDLDNAILEAQFSTSKDTVVKLLQDIDLGDDYQEIYGGVFTFDLDGFEVSSSLQGWGVLVLYYGADITIIDSGEGGKITGAGFGIEAYDSTVTISGGTIIGDDYGVYASDNTVKISDGTISGQSQGVYVDDSFVTISGGTISGREFGVEASDSTVEISAGTFSGEYGGVDASGGTVTISGGTISGGDYGVLGYDSTVTISGGTLSGEIGVYATGGTVEISGGTISGAYALITMDNRNVTISGGTISGERYDLYGDVANALILGEDGVGATFPGGITVTGATLNEILGEGAAYWQDGKQLSVTDDATSITGDVVIKAVCTHPGDKTYIDNGNDHTYSCNFCGLSATEAHTFVNGECICGKLDHTHNWSYQDNGDGTHTESCTCDSFVVEHVYENGVCICGALPAVSVTMDGVTMYYGDLNSAIQAVQSSTSKDTVVKLLKDINLGDTYQEIHYSVCTFDLNGFELSSLDDFWGALVLRNGADITIIDSGEGGKITGTEIGVETWGSTLTINGGTISGYYGVDAHGSAVELISGTIIGEYGLSIDKNSTLIISGGTISGERYDLYGDVANALILGENGVGATFPGGFKVGGTTLNAILGEGAAYWQNGKMIVPAEGATAITGGDVVIKAACKHEGTWVDATCTAPKTCSSCGATEGEPTGSHVDANNNGRCDTCNCLMQPAKLMFATMSLEGNIGINYYMLLSDAVINDPTAFMQFTLVDGEIITVPVSAGIPTQVGDEILYLFTCAVNAKEMTDDVLAQCFYEGGASRVYTYSVKAYCDHVLKNSTDEALKDLVRKMLNYGAASQEYFDYNTDDLANAGLEAPNYDQIVIDGFKAQAGQGTQLSKLYAASLILKSETTLRFFFNGPITATYNGVELEVGQRSGLYYVDVTGIAAADLDEEITITISDGVESADIIFNPMAYCQGVSQNSDDQELKMLVRALYLYNQAANAYFQEI